MQIEFKDIFYKIGNKNILNGISGKFTPGKLIAILGSSGAGKTTLLNILAGFKRRNVKGEILVNGKPTSSHNFHKISTYIMQDDCLQPLLTAGESLQIATMLKIGDEYTRAEKFSMMNDLIKELGLEDILETEVERLSGGQRKRLSIALELVDNPSLIFLDEPTTGLDNVSTRKCAELLKSITLQNKTVVCTIHQPSDFLFKIFDVVYFLSRGSCVYNGTVDEMVPFLAKNNFTCPINCSPSDYIIELVQLEFNATEILSETIANGKLQLGEDTEFKLEENNFALQANFPVSPWRQFRILLGRMFLQSTRNKIALALQIVLPLFVGFSQGMLFYKVGNSGPLMIHNGKLFFSMSIYFAFVYGMAPILFYPFEVKILQREYFNRWYGFKAYFFALTISTIPMLVITSIVYTIPIYIMTDQPLETYRIVWILIISILMALVSQGFGYSIGSLFNALHGGFVGSALISPLIFLAVYSFQRSDTWNPLKQALISISFPYHGYAGISTTILHDRGLVECDEIFCPFRSPKIILKLLGLVGIDYKVEALTLLAFYLMHKFVSYVCLRVRLTPDSRFVNYVEKFSNYVK